MTYFWPIAVRRRTALPLFWDSCRVTWRSTTARCPIRCRRPD